jgi:putative YphP/YqiW family bacilliredoxin
MYEIKRQAKYDENAIKPLREELNLAGFKNLTTFNEVEEVVNTTDNKTTLIVINSVCGCAAGSARPGVSLALQNKTIPDNLYTVFAGQDLEAVDAVRSHITSFPASSPSMAIFKDGKLVYFLPRTEIEGYTAEQVADKLVSEFESLCTGKGPSISAELFNKLPQTQFCGNKLELH